MARVHLARSARAALEELNYPLAEAVLDALDQLRRQPEAKYRLLGPLGGLRSYRVGVYRIVYELRRDGDVRVVAIRHRSEAALAASGRR